MEKFIRLKKMNALSLCFVMLFFMAFSLNAQESLTIKGKITANEGEALPGATVMEKGTTNGVITDIDGNYTIKVSSSSSVLTFSFIGYLSEEVPVGNQTNIEVKLVEDITALEEVVLIGYGSMRKVDVTGSVATVDVGGIESQKPQSVEQALQGKVAGLKVISSDGAPGAEADMQIRGIGSINASVGPLVIIDGLPYGNLNDVNPEDIESISVLKDASSTAIYGTRGSGGVILITTKRGSAGKTNVNVKALFGWQSLPKNLDFQNAEEFSESKMNKMYYQTGIDYNADDDPDADLGYSYYRAWNEKYYLDPEKVTDWNDLIFQPGKRQEYGVTITSGNDKITNGTSIGWLNNEGIVMTTGYKRATLRSNTDFKISDKFTIRNNISMAYRRKMGKQDFDNDGIFVRAGQFSPFIDKFMNFGDIRQWEVSGSGTVSDNPYLLLTERTITEDEYNLQGNLEFEYKIVKGLKLITSAGGNYGNSMSDEYSNLNLSNSANTGGKMTLNRDGDWGYRLLGQLVYDLKLDNHAFSTTFAAEATKGGNNKFKQTYEQFDQTLEKFGIQSTQYSSSSPVPEYSADKSSLSSFIGRFQYNYLERYLFSATVRADGSSKFGPDNKWGVFPSFGAGWRLSEENFMKNISWLPYAKIRGSWGQAGNDNIPRYLSLSMYEQSEDLAVFGTQVDATSETIVIPFHPSQIPNNGISWETTTETNVGLDLGFLKNRITIAFDVYSRITNDMLLEKELPDIVGVERRWENIGELTNKGFEFQLDAKIIDKSKFYWKGGFNFYRNQTIITKLQEDKVRDFNYDDPEDDLYSMIQINEPLGEKYGYVMEGVVNTLSYTRNGMRTQEEGGSGWGSPQFFDVSGDGTIDQQDKTIIFQPQSVLNGGITTEFGYGPFSLYMLFRGSYGSDIYNQNLGELGQTGNKSRSQLRPLAEEMWLPNNQDGTYVGPQSTFSDGFTSFVIENGSYFKFATLNFSIDIPKNIVSYAKLSGARISYTLDNVYTWTQYSGFDPDVSSGSEFKYYGTDRSAYPYSRSHLVTLNLTF